DTLCFHCQQTVEKLLKAFLVYHNVDFQKVHTIEYLIRLCSKIDNEFESLYEMTKKLTDYAVEVRYPDEFYILMRLKKLLKVQLSLKNLY
ncbi:MAG: HEPN domain-containing protein, partial [Brevinematia bacterium]